MKQPPTNRNVPDHIWNRAVEEYAEYKSQYDTLRQMGLSDEEAEIQIRMRNLFDRIEQYRVEHGFSPNEIEKFFYNGCEDNGAAEFERFG